MPSAPAWAFHHCLLCLHPPNAEDVFAWTPAVVTSMVPLLQEHGDSSLSHRAMGHGQAPLVPSLVGHRPWCRAHGALGQSPWATSTQSQGHLSSLWGCHCPRPLRALSPPVPQPALGPAPAAAPCCGLIPAGLFSRARCAWVCRHLKPSGLALGTTRPAVLEPTGSSAPHSRSLPSSPAGLGREGTVGSGCRSWH